MSRKNRRSHNKLIFLAAVLLLVPAAQGWATTELDTGISEVVVYAGGRAMITRVGTLRLPAGESEISVSGLPAALLDQTLRVEGTSTGKVSVTDTEIRQVFLAEAFQQQVRELEKKLEGLVRDREHLDKALEILAMEWDFLKALQAASGEDVSKTMLYKSPDTASLAQVLRFIGTSGEELAGRQIETKQKKKKLEARISALEQELNRLRGQGSRQSKTVVVTTVAKAPSSLTLTLHYVLSGAGWQPSYDAWAFPTKASVQLVYKGDVRNRTGENWDALITLSTARPTLSQAIPVLDPWYLRKAEPPVRYRKSGSRMLGAMNAPMAAPDPVVMEDTAVQEVSRPEAEVSTTEGVVTFRIPGKQDIPADGNEHATQIATIDLPATFTYVCVPTLSEHTYLAAEVTNPDPILLLPGKMNLFLGPDFVGHAALDAPLVKGARQKLSFGISQGVKAVRTLVSQDTEKGGLLRKTGRKTFLYGITVKNNLTKAAQVLLLDQQPVSDNPDIKVKLDRCDPPVSEVEDEKRPGVLAWKIDLAPGEEKEVNFSFTVEYPKNARVEGL